MPPKKPRSLDGAIVMLDSNVYPRAWQIGAYRGQVIVDKNGRVAVRTDPLCLDKPLYILAWAYDVMRVSG